VRAGGVPDEAQAASSRLKQDNPIKIVFMILSYLSQAVRDFISKT
jgi:hypothetical protein